MKKELILTGVISALLVIAVGLTVGWRDYDADYTYQTLWIPASSMEDSTQTSYMASGPVRRGVNNKQFGGFTMSTADSVAFLLTPPRWDNRFGIAERVHWLLKGNSLAVGSIVWKAHMSDYEPNTAMGISTGGTNSATITFTADSASAATAGVSRHYVTKWDTITYSTVDDWDVNDMLLGAVELDADGDASSDDVVLLGLEIAYVPKLTNGPGVRTKRVEIPGPTVLGQAKGSFVTRP